MVKIQHIRRFSGLYSFLSNFYITPVMYEDRVYPSSENAFQAAKFLDEKVRDEFRNPIMSPGAAKRYARTLKLRDDWEMVKDQVMLNIVRDKFSNPILREMLFATGYTTLEEGNDWHDTYWGVCDGNHKIMVRAGQLIEPHPGVSIGENRLGWTLEKIRFELRSGQACFSVKNVV